MHTHNNIYLNFSRRNLQKNYKVNCLSGERQVRGAFTFYTSLYSFLYLKKPINVLFKIVLILNYISHGDQERTG